MWHLRTQFSAEHGGWTDDLQGPFQPQWFFDSWSPFLPLSFLAPTLIFKCGSLGPALSGRWDGLKAGLLWEIFPNIMNLGNKRVDFVCMYRLDGPKFASEQFQYLSLQLWMGEWRIAPSWLCCYQLEILMWVNSRTFPAPFPSCNLLYSGGIKEVALRSLSPALPSSQPQELCPKKSSGRQSFSSTCLEQTHIWHQVPVKEFSRARTLEEE